MENNRNGSIWRLAFWVLSIICGVWLLSLSNWVAANDISARDRSATLTTLVNNQYSEIVQRLVRIETKVENKQ